MKNKAIPKIASLEECDDFLTAYENGEYQLYSTNDNKGNLKDRLVVNYQVKEALLTSFSFYLQLRSQDNFNKNYSYGKSLKTEKGHETDYYNDPFPLLQIKAKAPYRVLKGSIVRRGVYIAEKTVILPSFINIGSYINSNSTVDAGATIGSCAYLGEYVHVSSGATIGGVIEPVNQRGVYIGDRSFIGANSSVSEGVTIDTDVLLGAGTHITASTHIINAETGEEMEKGYLPPNSLCVNGTYKKSEYFSIQCVIFLKRTNRRKLINEKCH